MSKRKEVKAVLWRDSKVFDAGGRWKEGEAVEI